jgi:hypothetical protein
MTQKANALDFLGDGRWHPTHQLVAVIGDMRAIRRLREDGFNIEKRKVGTQKFEYRLLYKDVEKSQEMLDRRRSLRKLVFG